MSRSTLDTIAVVDTALARFSVNVEKLKVIIKVDGTSAEITAEKGRVCGEDCRDVYSALLR